MHEINLPVALLYGTIIISKLGFWGDIHQVLHNLWALELYLGQAAKQPDVSHHEDTCIMQINGLETTVNF